MSASSLPSTITPAVAESIQRRVAAFSRDNDLGAAERGLRAARARDPMFLRALEQVAETVGKLSEAQYGETRRSKHTDFSHRAEATVVSMWREAYRLADAGIYEVQFGYYYAAIAEFISV